MCRKGRGSRGGGGVQIVGRVCVSSRGSSFHCVLCKRSIVFCKDLLVATVKLCCNALDFYKLSKVESENSR
jgi:hypothetical protein